MFLSLLPPLLFFFLLFSPPSLCQETSVFHHHYKLLLLLFKVRSFISKAECVSLCGGRLGWVQQDCLSANQIQTLFSLNLKYCRNFMHFVLECLCFNVRVTHYKMLSASPNENTKQMLTKIYTSLTTNYFHRKKDKQVIKVK